MVGANGSGKSTILKAISGLTPVSSGEIWFGDERIDRLPPYEIVRRGVVQVPEGRRLFPYLCVDQHADGSQSPQGQGRHKEGYGRGLRALPHP